MHTYDTIQYIGLRATSVVGQESLKLGYKLVKEPSDISVVDQESLKLGYKLVKEPSDISSVNSQVNIPESTPMHPYQGTTPLRTPVNTAYTPGGTTAAKRGLSLSPEKRPSGGTRGDAAVNKGTLGVMGGISGGLLVVKDAPSAVSPARYTCV